jgi:hypothetical protein
LAFSCIPSDQIITTGKTSFLYLVLIIWLLHAKRTFFQTMGGSVYYISAQGVLKIPDPDGDAPINGIGPEDDVVALVDADGQGSVVSPRNVLFCSRGIRIILASPPRESRDRKWLKQSNVAEHVRVRTMDIWSEEELIITG